MVVNFDSKKEQLVISAENETDIMALKYWLELGCTKWGKEIFGLSIRFDIPDAKRGGKTNVLERATGEEESDWKERAKVAEKPSARERAT